MVADRHAPALALLSMVRAVSTPIWEAAIAPTFVNPYLN